MARPLRIEFPGAVYHVTSWGNARQGIVGATMTGRSPFPSSPCGRLLWLAVPCLLFEGQSLSSPRGNAAAESVAGHVPAEWPLSADLYQERVGRLFQGRFTAILVEKEAHLLERCRYVVLNPVRANLVPYPR